jgi:hypothetical protein
MECLSIIKIYVYLPTAGLNLCQMSPCRLILKNPPHNPLLITSQKSHFNYHNPFSHMSTCVAISRAREIKAEFRN